MLIPRLPSTILNQIALHAETQYPLECCGVLLGPVDERDAITSIERCRNIQDFLHQEDPAQYPAQAGKAYVMDPHDLLRLQKYCREHGQQIRVIYHSHPDADPFFSLQDQKLALWDGAPLYPESAYLVASVEQGKASRYALYQWNPVRQVFFLACQGQFTPSRI